jgi:hypothetical protein
MAIGSLIGVCPITVFIPISYGRFILFVERDLDSLFKLLMLIILEIYEFFTFFDYFSFFEFLDVLLNFDALLTADLLDFKELLPRLWIDLLSSFPVGTT